MSPRHVWAVTRKEIAHILRDRMTFSLVLLVPVVLLLLMAYALTVELQHIPIVVLDRDRSAVSRAFVQGITAGDDLDLYAQVEAMDEIESLLVRGEVKAAVVIAPDFGRQLRGLQGIPLQVIIDGTEPESGWFAVDHIIQRAEAFVLERLTPELRSRGASAAALEPIELRLRTWYNPGLEPRVDLVPGLISLVMGLPAISVALALAHEREHGTLEQLMVTPVSRLELIVGKMLPYLFVGLGDVLLLPAVARLWLDVPFHGSFPLFFVLSAVFLFSILSLGIVLGVFIRTQAAALALGFLIILFPGFFLTGIFFPIASMPEVVRLEALALPGTHYAIITRGLFLTGVGMDVLWPYAVMTFGLGLVFTVVAALFFRKRLD